MTLEGRVNDGVIVLSNGASLAEGTRVRVVVLEDEIHKDESQKDESPKPTLAGLLKYAGAITDLPADFAQQHDHYIHGTPKR